MPKKTTPWDLEVRLVPTQDDIDPEHFTIEITCPADNYDATDAEVLAAYHWAGGIMCRVGVTLFGPQWVTVKHHQCGRAGRCGPMYSEDPPDTAVLGNPPLLSIDWPYDHDQKQALDLVTSTLNDILAAAHWQPEDHA